LIHARLEKWKKNDDGPLILRVNSYVFSSKLTSNILC